MFAFGIYLWQATFGDMPQRDTVTAHITAASKECVAMRSPLNDLLRELLKGDAEDRPSAMESLLRPYFADTHEVSRREVKKHVCAVFYESLAGTQPYPSNSRHPLRTVWHRVASPTRRYVIALVFGGHVCEMQQ